MFMSGDRRAAASIWLRSGSGMMQMDSSSSNDDGWVLRAYVRSLGRSVIPKPGRHYTLPIKPTVRPITC
jgi:hypothetical protein